MLRRGDLNHLYFFVWADTALACCCVQLYTVLGKGACAEWALHVDDRRLVVLGTGMVSGLASDPSPDCAAGGTPWAWGT